MKILVGHNLYQHRGGEDAVVEGEVRLLESHGHTVTTYIRDNADLKDYGAFSMLKAGIETTWAEQSVQEIRAIIKKEKPDLCHFHNTFPLLSPACYKPCVDSGIPVIQTLHNYRLLCPAATLLREGKVCEDCLGRSVAWPGIVHDCYRGSRLATTAVAAMLATHRMIGTWQNNVDIYIALSEFSRGKFIAGGLPEDRIFVKPNFVYPDPGPKLGVGDYVLFVGRLSEEKGLRILLDAWSTLQADIPLRIVGDGPLKGELERTVHAKKLSSVEISGRLSTQETMDAMHGARFLVFPSIWYEGFPVTIAEAFACGVPVIASYLGSLVEIVQNSSTGLHFSPGSSQALAETVVWAWAHPEILHNMGRAARADYEAKYSAENNYAHFVSLWNHLGISASA
jgi:glycosyltransferase involved in cell wall biosynthesis